MRHRGARTLAAAVAALVLVPLLASPGQAATPPSSQAFGLSATVTVAVLPLTIAPQAASAYPGGPSSMNSGSLAGLGTLNLISTTASGSNAAGTTDASTSLAGLSILNLLSAGAVESSCTADGGGVTGSGSVANLQALGLPVNAGTGANTTVNIAGLGTIVLNEQTETSAGGRYRLSVNALHITANVLGVLTGDIVVGHAECEADAQAPAVTALSPASGPSAGGTSVTITGTGFTQATGVDFGGVPATSFTVVNGSTITATAPAHAPGLADVVVSNRTGASAPVPASRFTFIAPPAVGGLSPSAGPAAAGTVVTITGTDLTGATAVGFGATPAVGFTVDSATQITATAPAGVVGSTVDVTVSTPSGTSPVVPAGAFSYVNLPGLSSILPASGPLAGGYPVTITGTDLGLAGHVSFGGTTAAFTVDTPTQITATVPAGSAGPVHIVVTSPAGTSVPSSNDVFTYASSPAAGSLDVHAGPAGGGTPVTVSGSGFTGVTSVTFGGTTTPFTVVNDSTLTTSSPGGSAGSVDVRITSPGGTSPNTPADDFEYVDRPVVSGISPSSGPASGGTTIISGTGLDHVTAVHLGVHPATFTIDSPTQITVQTPAGSAGDVHITVTSPGGTSATSAADVYRYVAAPQLALLTPSTGPAAGGTSVIVSGSDLSGASAVTFGGVPATSFHLDSATQITAVAPAGAPGPAVVVVTTIGGTDSATFTYTAAPVTPAPAAPSLTGVSPARGPVTGGTTITLTGAHFSSATGVRFGTVLGTDVTVVDDSTIRVTTPAHSRGSAGVTVLGPGGSSTPVGFSFLSAADAPAVTSVTPARGPVAGGTRITLRGGDFDAFTTVSFGGAAGTGLVLGPLTGGVARTLTVLTPAHAAGLVAIDVSNAGGSATAGPAFAYLPPPSAATITLRVTAGTSKLVAPQGVPYAGVTVRACSSARTTLAADLGGCVYTAPATAGIDRFTMSVVDALGQTAIQKVNVVVVAPSGSGDNGSGGSGSGGSGSGGSGNGGGGSGTGGGGGTGGTGGNGGTGGAGGTGGTAGTSTGSSGTGGSGTDGSGTTAAAGTTGGTGSTGTVDSQLSNAGDELNAAQDGHSSWWLWLLAALLSGWFLWFLWRRRHEDDEAERNRLRYERMMAQPRA